MTDRELGADHRASPRFGGRMPLPYETSAPGIFAVGEGSSAVRSVHDYLAQLG